MKCMICKKGTMKPFTDALRGVSYEALRCDACREEILTGSQLHALGEAYNEAHDGTFATWGNSMGIRIPQTLVREFKIKNGSKTRILKSPKGILLVPY